MGKSLQKKLTLFVVGLLLAMAALLSLVSYHQMRIQLLGAVRGEAEAATNGYGRLISDWVASKRQIVQSVVSVAADEKALAYFQRAAEGGGFDTVYGGYPDKRLISSDGWAPPADYDPSSRPWYKMAADSGNSILTEPYLDAQTGNLVVSFASPVKGSNGVSAVVADSIIFA